MRGHVHQFMKSKGPAAGDYVAGVFPDAADAVKSNMAALNQMVLISPQYGGNVKCPIRDIDPNIDVKCRKPLLLH